MAERIPAGLRKTTKTTNLIINAIDALRGTAGSSLNEITNYVAADSGIPPARALRNVKLAIKKGIDYGVIKKAGALYKMQNVVDADELMRANRRRRRSRKGDVKVARRRRSRKRSGMPRHSRRRRSRKGGRRSRRGGRRSRKGGARRRRRSSRHASRQRRSVVPDVDEE